MDQKPFDKYRQNKTVEFYQWGDEQVEPEKFENFCDCWVIFDDCLELIKPPDFIRMMAVKLSHHYRFSFTLVCHNFYTKIVPNWHEVTQNLHYIFWCAGKRNFDQFSIVARQILSKDWRALVEVYKKVIEEDKFNTILLDLHPHSPAFAKIRTHIMPNQSPIRVYLPLGQKLITK